MFAIETLNFTAQYRIQLKFRFGRRDVKGNTGRFTLNAIPYLTTSFSNHLGIEGLEPSTLRMKVGGFYVRYKCYLIKAPLPEPYRHLSMHTAL